MFFKTRKALVTVVVLAIVFAIGTPKIAEAKDYGSRENNFGLTKLQMDFVDRWYPTVKAICFDSYRNGKGASDVLALVTFGLESYYGTSRIFQDKNNGYGIDAYATDTESIYEHARWFDTVEDCIREYCRIIVEGYPKAAKHYDNPYLAIEFIAPSYAPGSDNYVSDVESITDRISLYLMSKYGEYIKQAEEPLEYARKILVETNQEYIKHLGRKKPSGIEKLASRYNSLLQYTELIDIKKIEFERSIANIEDNIRKREGEYEAAIARAKPIIHVLALGVKYGHFDNGEIRKHMFGDAYDLIMAEYENL